MSTMIIGKNKCEKMDKIKIGKSIWTWAAITVMFAFAFYNFHLIHISFPNLLLF